jgi:hypothetical protein
MTHEALTATDFYKADASEVYAEKFDFTVIESAALLPGAVKMLCSAISRTLATAVVAAVTGILMIPPGGMLSFGVSEACVIRQDGPRAPEVVTMTAFMRERAALAAQVFQRTPHLGADDIEPDYGF